jgi:pyruvate,water dikinase
MARVTNSERSVGMTLLGTPASPGRIRGVAYLTGRDGRKRSLGNGEILVCPALSDEVADLAEQAAGVVADRGGPLSHGATRMRELGHPAVVGAALATQVIADGELIELDGASGLVRRVTPRQCG